MSVNLMAVTFDCANAAELADFWSGVLDLPVQPDASGHFAMLGSGNGVAPHPVLMFIKVPEGKLVKNRVHIDLSSTNWAADVDRAVGLGAKRLGDFDESGARWITLIDPEGNEFDIVDGAH